MSYILVIRHIQRVLNSCGDPVIFTPTGKHMMNSDFKISIEIKKVSIKKKNNCFPINPPNPICEKTEKSDTEYQIDRIRISKSLIDDYSKGFSLSDEEMKRMIANNKSLFGCYDKE